MIKIKQSKLFILMFLSLIILFSIYPLMQPGLIDGHDIDFHLMRIEAIKSNLQNGDLLSLIHSKTLSGYGYGVGLFYPNFFMYVPVCFRIVGFSIVNSYKIFVVIVSVATCITTYFSAKVITKSRYASLIATTLFLLSQYRLVNVYTRAAVGEYLAMIFFPVIICGIYDLLYNNFSKPWILCLGFCGVMLSHTISLAIVLAVMIIFCIVHIKIFFNNPKLVIRIIASAIIVLLLTCSYWLTMLEQFSQNEFNVNFSSLKMKDMMQFSRVFDLYWLGMGIPIVVFSMLRLFQSNSIKYKEKMKLADEFLIIGLTMLVLSTNLFPWGLFKNTIIKNIQFPWRLLGVASLLLAFSIAIICNIIFRGGQRKVALFTVLSFSVVFACLLLNTQLSYQREFPSNYYDISENTASHNSIGWGEEWLPSGTNISRFTDSSIVRASDNNDIYIKQKVGNRVLFAANDSEYYDVPLLFYKGYEAEILKFDGSTEQLQVLKSPNNNLVRVINDKLTQGEIVVKYSGTNIQHISYAITFMSIIGVAVYFAIRNSKNSFKNFLNC